MRGHRCATEDFFIALLDTPGEATPAIQGGTKVRSSHVHYR